MGSGMAPFSSTILWCSGRLCNIRQRCATSGDDSSSFETDQGAGKAVSPVVGLPGQEPPPVVPEASAPPDAPGAQDSDDVPILRVVCAQFP